MNQVAISGNLGGDPDLRHTAQGTPVCTFSVCVNHRQKVGDEWKNNPNWVSVTFWGNRAEAISKNLKRGAKVFVSGRLNQNTWKDDQGNSRSKLEVIGNEIEWESNGKGISHSQKSDAPVVDASVYDADVPF